MGKDRQLGGPLRTTPHELRVQKLLRRDGKKMDEPVKALRAAILLRLVVVTLLLKLGELEFLLRIIDRRHAAGRRNLALCR